MIGRCFFAVGGFSSGLWRGGLVRRVLLGDFGMEKGFAGGVTGRIMAYDGALAARLSARLKKPVDNSLIVSTARGVGDNLLHISLRSYGLFFVLTGGIPTVYSFVIHGYVGLALAAGAAAGLPLVLINRSIAQIYNGSLFLQKIGRFFFVKDYGLVEKPRRHYLPLFIAAGLAFGGLAVALELALFVMILAAAGSLLVLYKTEVGVFAAALLMPIVPTMMILGLMAVCFVSFVVKAAVTGRIALKFNAIDAFVAFFGFVVMVSSFLSFNRAASAPVALVYILFVLFYFVVKNTINTRAKFLALLSFIVAGGFAVAGFGVWQRLTGNFVMTDAWVDAQFFGETMVRVYSTLENPNVLGKYLIFVIIAAFGMLYYMKENLHKLAAAGIFAVASAAMLLTQSRGAWLGAIFAMGVFALIRDRRLVVLGVVALVLAPFFVPQDMLMRFLSIGDLTETSTSFRLAIWLASLEMIRVFWPVGIGLGAETFSMMYNLYAFSAAYALHTHNLYLQVIIDLGLAGFAAFVLIISGFFKGGLMAAVNGDKAVKTAAAALVAAMAGYLIMGFTDNVWFNYRVLGFFWLIVAAVAAAGANFKEWGIANDKTKI